MQSACELDSIDVSLCMCMRVRLYSVCNGWVSICRMYGSIGWMRYMVHVWMRMEKRMWMLYGCVKKHIVCVCVGVCWCDLFGMIENERQTQSRHDNHSSAKHRDVRCNPAVRRQMEHQPFTGRRIRRRCDAACNHVWQRSKCEYANCIVE